MQLQPITIYGRSKLSNELHQLKTKERPATIEEIDIARSHGDLKENAEYHAARERLRFIEARIAELGVLYDNSQAVDPSLFSHERVRFGSTVTLNNVNTDQKSIYTIVGTYESNPEKGLISMLTPLAQALIGKEEGDDVSLRLPGGVTEYEVENICYKEIIFDD